MSNKLRTFSPKIVEKLDLVGLDFLWEVCLNSVDVSIAEKATSLLMTMSYANLSARLKRVSTQKALELGHYD